MNKQGLLAGTAVVFLLLFCMACGDPASDKQALRDRGRERALCETEEEAASVWIGDRAEAIKTADGDKKAPKEEKKPKWGHYTVTAEITVDNGRKLDLILHGFRPEDRSRYGIDKIDVYDGADLIQTISVKEAMLEEGTANYGYIEGYTETWDEDGGLYVGDMNFDGVNDIGLFAWITTGANIPYYYWLWDKEEQQFTYAFCICEPTLIDTEKEQIEVDLRDGACGRCTEYYAYDENGELQLVGYIYDDYSDDVLKREIYELIDGEMQLIGEEPLQPMVG